MIGFEEDTPIYNQMMRDRATPIFDQLALEREFKQYDELVEPYRSVHARTFSVDEFWRELRDANKKVKERIARFESYFEPRHVEFTHFEWEENKEKLMEKWQGMVVKFRNAMDLPVSEFPRTLTDEEAKLHIQMIRDEFEKEFVPAFLNKDLVEMYDAGIDVIVYVLGAMSHAGFDVDPGMVEVMRSNMSKMDPETGKAIKAGPNDPSGEPEGKVLKGPNYSPPNLSEILDAQKDYILGDDTVYAADDIPLTLGEGGEQIGTASLSLNHRGEVTIAGEVDSRELFPETHAISVVDHYSVKTDEGTTINLEDFDIDYNHAELLTERMYESGMPDGVHIFPPYDR